MKYSLFSLFSWHKEVRTLVKAPTENRSADFIESNIGVFLLFLFFSSCGSSVNHLFFYLSENSFTFYHWWLWLWKRCWKRNNCKCYFYRSVPIPVNYKFFIYFFVSFMSYLINMDSLESVRTVMGHNTSGLLCDILADISAPTWTRITNLFYSIFVLWLLGIAILYLKIEFVKIKRKVRKT